MSVYTISQEHTLPKVLADAYRLVAAGVSVLPIKPDGSKAPALASWKPYQSRPPTGDELRHWFQHRPLGLGIIGGAVSGSLEILDFDAPEIFTPWSTLVEDRAPGLLARLPQVETPSDGRHVYYRCLTIAGNLKLAQRLTNAGRPETLIETRGESGYAIVPPSPAACHPSNRPYVLRQGHLTKIPVITAQERAILLNTARSFNAYVPPERVVVGPRTPVARKTAGERPGDLFNRHAEWPDILEPRGWTRVRQRGEVTLWKRPGKQERSTSATTNYAEGDLLFVFSSNAYPFEPERAYDKFAAYTLLEHRGDFQAAARLLALKGYRRSKPGERLPPLHDPWLGPRWRLHGVPLAVRRLGVEVRHGA
jgi:Bifunctional DNA primase/polymerase, N-terminal